MQAEKTGITELDAYLARMARELRLLPASERKDLLRELAGNLQDSLANEDVAAALARLGPAERFAAALMSERQIAVDRRRTAGEVLRIIVRAASIPFVWGILAFSLMMLFNTWYLYLELARSWSLPVVARLLVLNLPAVLVIGLGVAAMFAGLTGLPSLARGLSRPLFKRVLPASVVGILAAGALLSVANFYLSDRVVTSANRAVVDLVRAQLHEPPFTEAERSPQEMTLDTIQVQASNAKTRDARRTLQLAYQFRYALAALTFGTTALGCALGALLAGRVKRPVMVGAPLGVAAIFLLYTAMSIGRGAVAALGPQLAAWLPVYLSLGLAALLGLLAAWLPRPEARDV